MQKIVLGMNHEISLDKLFQNNRISYDPNEEYVLELEIVEGSLYFVERFKKRELKSFVIVKKALNATILHDSYFLRTVYDGCVARYSISKKEFNIINEHINLYQSSLN